MLELNAHNGRLHVQNSFTCDDATTRRTLDARFCHFVKLFFTKNRTFLCQTLRHWFDTTDAERFKSRRFIFARCWMPLVLACAGALASASCLAQPSDKARTSDQISDVIVDGRRCGLWIHNGEKREFWLCSSRRKQRVHHDYDPPDDVMRMLHGRPPDPLAVGEPRQGL